MKRKRPKGQFEHIGPIIETLVKTYRRESDTQLVRIWDLWDDVLGEPIVQNARPAAFKGKILLVHVTSPVWIHQLQYLKQEMIAKLNAALGKNLISDLKFKIGPPA